MKSVYFDVRELDPVVSRSLQSPRSGVVPLLFSLKLQTDISLHCSSLEVMSDLQSLNVLSNLCCLLIHLLCFLLKSFSLFISHSGLQVLGHYIRRQQDPETFISEIKYIASDPDEKFFFNVTDEAALNDIVDALGDRIFTLEGV